MKTIFTIILVSLFASCEAQTPPKKSGDKVTVEKKAASPGEKAKAMVKAGAILLDVRTPGEFQSGSLPGAINIPVQNLTEGMAKLDKSKDIVVFCASGARSGRAKGMLEKAGFKMVFNMGGKSAWE